MSYEKKALLYQCTLCKKDCVANEHDLGDLESMEQHFRRFHLMDYFKAHQVTVTIKGNDEL